MGHETPYCSGEALANRAINQNLDNQGTESSGRWLSLSKPASAARRSIRAIVPSDSMSQGGVD